MKILSTTAGGVVKDVDWIERGLDRELVKKGHYVESFSSTSVKKVFPNAKNKETIDGVKIKRFIPILPSSFFEMLKGDWDVIHANHLGYLAPISSYAALRKKIKPIPMVFTVHGIYHDPFVVEDVQDPFAGKINYGIKRSLDPVSRFVHTPLFTADKVTALTQWEKKELVKFGIAEEKIEVIPNGINLNIFRKVRSRKKFRKKHDIKGPMLIFAGQPIRRKGAEYLINSLPDLIKAFEDLKCVFIGYRKSKNLEEQCKKLGIISNTLFLGFLPEKEKTAALKASDIFIFPTLYEGFGTVMLEAMAAGCPVITTRTAGNPEIIKNNHNGVLVQPKSQKEITEAVKKLLNDKPKRNRIKHRNKKDAKKYSWKNVAKKFEQVFEETKTQKRLK